MRTGVGKLFGFGGNPRVPDLSQTTLHRRGAHLCLQRNLRHRLSRPYPIHELNQATPLPAIRLPLQDDGESVLKLADPHLLTNHGVHPFLSVPAVTLCPTLRIRAWR